MALPRPAALLAILGLTLLPHHELHAQQENQTMPDTTPTVLITGSNRGIGLEFARQYTALGWRVIATCRNPDRSAELNALAAQHPNLSVEALDLADHTQVDSLAAKYRDQPVDVLLNNAAYLGATEPQLLGQLDYALFREILAVNVIGTLKVSEAFLDHVLASRQKKIVILGSAAGSNGLLGPVPNLYAYRSSKAALHLAAHTLALDLAPRGVRVGLINPGVVDTKGVLDLEPGDPVPDVFKPLMPLIKSGEIPLIRPAESVAGMIALIDTLTPEQAGRFLNYDGTELPW
jgi:NAD(P)-dependent dehydrogenase (short-subunit alcohol dehydrogenase family)